MGKVPKQGGDLGSDLGSYLVTLGTLENIIFDILEPPVVKKI